LRKTKALLATIGLVLVLSLLSAAQNGKVESTGPLTDSAVPDKVRESLNDKGYRLTLDDPKPACELWLRKSIPAATKKGSEAVAYPQLAESTLVGVVHFFQAAADFRGHQVPAGFYTLRYSLIPDDGNHLGVSPNPDFLLLIPAQSDADPSAAFKFQELVTMSARTGGTKHPSPLSLPPADKPSVGTVARDDQDHWIFSASLKLASGEEIPFALIVKGTAQQ
jgi:predicted small lipoprotein YifL